MTTVAPERLGQYELLRRLAAGGMGEVFLARQSGPGGFSRTVVVKRLLPHLASDPAFVQMFVNEARVVSQLSHPNIAQVFEFGEERGAYYLCLEFVRGRTLLQVIKALKARQRLLNPALAVELVVQTLRGLQHAHALRVDGQPAPVIHRDMSPDNILVGLDGRARIIDFGIARSAELASTTRTGTIKGKFAYMAPERFSEQTSREADPRLDVYSMGVVLYECLTGQRPFRGSTDAALVGAILSAEPAPMHELNAATPEALSTIVSQAIARSPEARLASAGAFSAALESWAAANGGLAGEAMVATLMTGLFGDDDEPLPVTPQVAAPTSVEVSRFEPPPRRWPWAVAAGVGVVGAALWLGLPRREGPMAVSEAPMIDVVDSGAPPVVVAAVPARSGRVVFRVKPWGEIWLGEARLGVTPNVRVERPAGRYTFTVRHPDFPPRALSVEVQPDTEVMVKVDLTAR